MILVNKSTGSVIAGRVRVAKSFAHRLCGLMGQRHFNSGTALVLQPCKQVHTFFMRFSIDVLFLDGHGTVLTALFMPPGRVSPYVRAARMVVELPAGITTATGTAENHILQLIEQEGWE